MLRNLYDIAVELFHRIFAAVKPGNNVVKAVEPVMARGDFYIQAPLVHGSVFRVPTSRHRRRNRKWAGRNSR